MELPWEWDATAWGLALGAIGISVSVLSMAIAARASGRADQVEKDVKERLAQNRVLAQLVRLAQAGDEISESGTSAAMKRAFKSWRSEAPTVLAFLENSDDHADKRLLDNLTVVGTFFQDSLTQLEDKVEFREATKATRQHIAETTEGARVCGARLESGFVQ